MTTSFNTMGIIGAMDVEIALLREEMAKAGTVKITRIAGMEFNVGTIGNTTVIVVQCGVGMVNAATCAQVLVDRFGVSALLNTGIAARWTHPSTSATAWWQTMRPTTSWTCATWATPQGRRRDWTR